MASYLGLYSTLFIRARIYTFFCIGPINLGLGVKDFDTAIRDSHLTDVNWRFNFNQHTDILLAIDVS